MIIKQKSDLSQATILFIDYLKSISVEGEQSDPHKADPQASISAVYSKVDSSSEEKKLKLFLGEVAANRKRNELIYGYKTGFSPSQEANKQWGVEAVGTADFYRKNFDSTITRGEGGWAEFGISYDNKFFLSPTSADSEDNHFKFNHEIMGCGTFLKAAGKLKLENGKLSILPHSQYLALGPYYLSIILFVLREKGYPLSASNTFILGEEGSPLQYVEFIAQNYIDRPDAVSYYLSETGFPVAKAIAENKKLSIVARLSDLSLSIDDEILSGKRQGVVKHLDAIRAGLKADIIGFLWLLVETDLCAVGEGPKKQEQREDSLEGISQETVYQRYTKIITHIQTFQSHRVDISFVSAELSSWFYYLSALSFQTGGKTALQEIEVTLRAIKETPSILPQRFMVEPDGSVSPFIRFYTENPIKTSIALLRDYTKGGFWGRFFSGAWRRHHVKSVEQFLINYDAGRFPDDLSVQTIYQVLFGLEGALEKYPGKQGTLFARLLFCAKPANETQTESYDQAFVNISLSASSMSNEEIEEVETKVVGASQESLIFKPSISPGTSFPTSRWGNNIRFHTLPTLSPLPSPPPFHEDKVFWGSKSAAANDKQEGSTKSPTLSHSSLSE